MKQILPLTDGLFNHMNYTFRTEVTKTALDLQFLANYGKRNPSPIVEMIQDEYGTVMDSAKLTTLAGVIVEMYKEKWDKLGDIYDIQYDPIHNYLDQWNDRSSEVIDRDTSKQELDNVTYGKTDSLSTTRSDTGTTVTNVTDDNTRTITDDLTKTETRNMRDSTLRTDNLSEQTTYGRTDTTTDNLSEEISYGKTETRTDNLTETNTYGKTDTRTDNLTDATTFGKSETRTDNLTQGEQKTESVTGSNSNTDSVWAFNSSNASNTDASSGSNSNSTTINDTIQNTGTQTNASSGTDSTNHTGTETHALSGSDGRTNTGTQATADSGKDTTTNTGTQATVSSGSDSISNTGTRTTATDMTGTLTTRDAGTKTVVDDRDVANTVNAMSSRTISSIDTLGGTDSTARSGSGTEDVTTNKSRDGSHFGNIGNLTSQKQILEEINLWKWNYVKEILSDVKEFCTLPVYLNASEWQLVDQS